MTHEQVLDLAAAFVLGAVEPDEDRAVREHLATCPLSHEDLAELGSVVSALAESVNLVEPPAALRERVMAAAARDLDTRPSAAPQPIARPPTPSAEAGPARPATRLTAGPARFGWALGLAAVIVIAALGAWNLSLRSDFDAAMAYRQHVEQVLTAAARAGSHSAILSSKDNPAIGGLAVVSNDGSVQMVMRGLAPTTGSKVYEAWVIVPETDPVPVGSFTVGSDGTGYLTASGAPAAAGVTVALTLEPGPGATTPTPPIISAGVASS
ncbi:MAG TPA: anti-sigma factor [Candidatus Limnocylindria bacterium]|nr:anti-sigma factor [Candidatus Limnocylindria bacterium]